jgi:hypothetical protein
VLSCAGDREISEDFADRGRELEAVPGAGRGDHDLGRARQAIDDEIAVGSHGVEAGLGLDHSSIGGRQVLGDGGTDEPLVLGGDGSIAGLGFDVLVGVVMLGDLDGGRAQDWKVVRKAVVDPMAAFHEENRQAAAGKR